MMILIEIFTLLWKTGLTGSNPFRRLKRLDTHRKKIIWWWGNCLIKHAKDESIYRVRYISDNKSRWNQSYLGYGILFVYNRWLVFRQKSKVHACVRGLKGTWDPDVRISPRNFNKKTLCEIALQLGRECSYHAHILYFKSILRIINVFNSLFSELHSINMINYCYTRLNFRFFIKIRNAKLY